MRGLSPVDGTMRITIEGDARPADLPMLLALFVDDGVHEIPDKWARRWVEERVPPRGRQNLGEILRANGLDSYDEVALLAAGQGRSAQDDFLVRELPQTDALPRADEPSRVVHASVELPSATEQGTWCAMIGSQLASRRKAAGMTQRDLAEKTGVGQAAISRIESGRANPTLDTLEALCDGLDAHLQARLV